LLPDSHSKKTKLRDTRPVLRPLELVLLIAELPAGILAAELPVDFRFCSVGLLVPGLCLALERGEIGNPALSEALAREQADLDLGS
jgi:hypothetical protein